MDGLLINSEDLYTICTNEVLRECGRPDLPWNIKAQLQGRPGPEAGRIFQQWAQLPLSDEEFKEKITKRQQQYFPTARPLPGVPELLLTLSQVRYPKLHLALASSSHRANFHLKTDHQKDLFSVFPEENRLLGDDPRIPRGRGKPAPDIYLLALKTINDGLKRHGDPEDIKPEECLVFEDSVPGVEAGRRAQMQVVWCPHPGLLKEYHGREKEVLAGLTNEYREEANSAVEAADQQRVSGTLGRVDDGWAILVRSLEQFPFDRFGIQV